jgi:outer membrane lipoprotein LolB
MRIALLLIVVLSLSACASREVRDDGAWLADREALFRDHPNWSVSGRLALSDGDRGGSLSFRWDAQGDQHLISLRTVAGGRQWRLEFNQRTAVLEGSEVGRLTGSNPDPLVEAAVGWPIPVQDLVWWVRGLVPPTGSRDLRYADDGTLAYAESPPWALTFERYGDFEATVLPSRLEAESGRYRVRMALRNWQLGVHP